MTDGRAARWRVNRSPGGPPTVSIQRDGEWVEIGWAEDFEYVYYVEPEEITLDRDSATDLPMVSTRQGLRNRRTGALVTAGEQAPFDDAFGDELSPRRPRRPWVAPGCDCPLCTGPDQPWGYAPPARWARTGYREYYYNDPRAYGRDEYARRAEYDAYRRQMYERGLYDRPAPRPEQNQAADKAERLLRRLLSDEQVRQWESRGSFEVTGSEGTRFRIYRYASGNVSVLDENGRDGGRLCAAPEQVIYVDGEARVLPNTDMVVGQLLLIRNDELAFWKVANHYIPGPASDRRRREIMQIIADRAAKKQNEAMATLGDAITNTTAAFVGMPETITTTQVALDPLLQWAVTNRPRISDAS